MVVEVGSFSLEISFLIHVLIGHIAGYVVIQTGNMDVPLVTKISVAPS